MKRQKISPVSGTLLSVQTTVVLFSLYTPPIFFSDRNGPREPSHWPKHGAIRPLPLFRQTRPVLATNWLVLRIANRLPDRYHDRSTRKWPAKPTYFEVYDRLAVGLPTHFNATLNATVAVKWIGASLKGSLSTSLTMKRENCAAVIRSKDSVLAGWPCPKKIQTRAAQGSNAGRSHSCCCRVFHHTSKYVLLYMPHTICVTVPVTPRVYTGRIFQVGRMTERCSSSGTRATWNKHSSAGCLAACLPASQNACNS